MLMKILCEVSEPVEAFITCHNNVVIMLVTLGEGLQMELGQLCGGDALTYQPLYEMVQVTDCWSLRSLHVCVHTHAYVCVHVCVCMCWCPSCSSFSIVDFKWEFLGYHGLDGVSQKCLRKA